jgi:hypothetical protein
VTEVTEICFYLKMVLRIILGCLMLIQPLKTVNQWSLKMKNYKYNNYSVQMGVQNAISVLILFSTLKQQVMKSVKIMGIVWLVYLSKFSSVRVLMLWLIPQHAKNW